MLKCLIGACWPGQARPVHILLMRASAVHITYVSSSTGKGCVLYQTEVTGFMVIPKNIGKTMITNEIILKFLFEMSSCGF